ncbi:TPA: hypothetical protein PRM15_002748, partial [Staphylococcus aureus]|nr:hypothetical protein [Staphylococcus aureus]
GATTKNNPTNFKFTDNNHEYKYTSADSQLYMAFNNRDIVVESWDVNYINDPFDLFEKLNEQVNQGVLEKKYKDEEILKTISWVIYDENGNIPTNSGFNAFNGGSKLGLSTRAKRINKIYDEYKFKVNEEKIKKVKKLL